MWITYVFLPSIPPMFFRVLEKYYGTQFYLLFMHITFLFSKNFVIVDL